HIRAEQTLAEIEPIEVRRGLYRRLRRGQHPARSELGRLRLRLEEPDIVPPDGSGDVVLGLSAGVVERVAVHSSGTQEDPDRAYGRSRPEDLADHPPVVSADRHRRLVDEVEAVEAPALLVEGVDLERGEAIGLDPGAHLEQSRLALVEVDGIGS